MLVSPLRRASTATINKIHQRIHSRSNHRINKLMSHLPSPSSSPPPSPSSPLFSFGLLSDIQYADSDMRYNYSKTEKRQYRNSLKVTQRAIQAFIENNNNLSDNKPISFIIHCGDIIDGINQTLLTSKENPHETLRALRHVMSVLEGRIYEENINDPISLNHQINNHPKWPVYHLIGNHELYCNDRAHWIQQFQLTEKAKSHHHHHKTIKNKTDNKIINNSDNINNKNNNDDNDNNDNDEIDCMFPLIKESELNRSDQAYYAIEPHPNFTFIFLDSYDISLLSYPPNHPHAMIAKQILDDKNPNDNKDSPMGLKGLNKRFVKFNGGIGYNQLLWLNSILKECQKNNKNVLIFSHIPFHPSACSSMALTWNYSDVLNLLMKYKECIKLCIAGHDHDGYEHIDHKLNIQFITVPGIIATEIGDDRFGRVDVYNNRIHVTFSDLPDVDVQWKYNDSNSSIDNDNVSKV